MSFEFLDGTFRTAIGAVDLNHGLGKVFLVVCFHVVFDVSRVICYSCIVFAESCSYHFV